MFHRERVPGWTKHIISIDPAVTKKNSSDFTGIAVLSWSSMEQRVTVRYTEQVKK